MGRHVPLLLSAVLLAACSSHHSATPSPPTPSATPSATVSPSPSPIATVTPSTAPSTAHALDVTFTSLQDAWVLVTTHCGGTPCTRLLRSHDRLRTWTSLPAPAVTHVRFASATTGYAWADGGRLQVTHDAGATWRRTGLDLVADVEAAAGTVWAIAGEQPYPHVWTAPVGGTTFHDLGQTPNRSATLDVHGSYAYVVGQSGAGPVAPSLVVGHAGQLTTRPGFPCRGANYPVSALTVSTDGSLFLVCVPDTSSGRSTAWTSTDRGTTWHATRAPGPGVVDVAAARGVRWAWDGGLHADAGSGWTTVIPGQVAFAGFEDDTHGVALLADGRLEVKDPGVSWRVVRL